MPRQIAAGFTLLEVMVALTIVAIALGAILSTSAKDTSNLSYLRDKTLAHWVAMNQINLLRATREFPEGKNIEGVEFMADKNWYYHYEIKDTPIPQVRRVDMEVRAEDADDAPILATASAFFDIEDEEEPSETTPDVETPELPEEDNEQ